MNYPMRAAIVVLGVGLAATAQANSMVRHSAAPAVKIHHAATGHLQRAAAHTQTLTRQQVRTAQQQLKSDGLYKGPIDGMMNHQTRVAIANFQKQNGLARTARLDRNTLGRLTGDQGVGVGSSMPNNPKAPAPVIPSATTTGAGGTTAPSTPTTSH
jgi:peptidoglycan hydrolase-like protein with peptidoglycan-binding domain